MSQHTWLIVDDDPSMLAVVQDVCAAIECKTVTATNLAEVKARVDEGGFCGVLLDLQIPAEPHGRPLVGAGEAALRLLRKHDARTVGDHHVLPIVILSGYSDAPGFSFRFGQLGADDYISKTFDDGSGGGFAKRLEQLSAQLVTAMQRAGRADHASCEALRPERATPMIHLRITGEKAGRRYNVHVDGRACPLQAAWLLMLLKLALAHRKEPGVLCTYRELGVENTTHAARRLREELASPESGEVVEVVYGQGVRLSGNVKVELDEAALAQHPDADVRKLFARRR